MDYYLLGMEGLLSCHHFTKELPGMKLVIRIFALSVAVAGFAAASISSPSREVASRQGAHASLPIPTCGPTMDCTRSGTGEVAK